MPETVERIDIQALLDAQRKFQEENSELRRQIVEMYGRLSEMQSCWKRLNELANDDTFRMGDALGRFVTRKDRG